MAAKTLLLKIVCRHHARTIVQRMRSAGDRNSYLCQGHDMRSGVTRAVTTVTKENIICSPHKNVNIPETTLTEFMFSRYKEFGNLTAVQDYLTGRSYSYSALTEAAIKVASGLTRMGIKKGDRILMFSTNCPEYLILFLACGATGAVLSTANPAYTVGELRRQLEHCAATTVVVHEHFITTVEQAINSSEKLKRLVKNLIVIGQKDGYMPFSTLLEDDGKAFPENVDIRPDDVIGILYSSGTTGLPKGVLLSHKNILANVIQSMTPAKMEPGKDKLLAVLPMFHIYGLVFSHCCTTANGATVVSMPSYISQDFLQAIQTHKITNLHLVPPLALFLAKSPSVSGYDLSSVHTMVSAAAPLGEGISRQLATRMSANVVQAYGLTETSPVISLDVIPAKMGSVGPLVPNTEALIVDMVTEKTLPHGQEGEICVRGPQVMLGYLDNQKETDDMIVNGWLHTGDIGFFGKDGHLTVTSRQKELIKYKGFQVAPAELESLLLSHPSVEDVAVIGVPDEKAGELPKAFVVLKEWKSISERQLADFVKVNVSSYKQLRGGVHFIDAIPKSPSGKILKLKLKKL